MFWNNSRTFYNLFQALGSFGFLPLRGAGTGFVIVLPLPLIFDPPLHTLHFTLYTTFHREATLKTALDRITGLQRQDSKPSADNNMRYSPSTSIIVCIKFKKRAQLSTDFWQLDDSFESPGRNELLVWKTDSRFFFLSPHTPYGVWGSRASRAQDLRHALPISLLILRKKTDCFAV